MASSSLALCLAEIALTGILFYNFDALLQLRNMPPRPVVATPALTQEESANRSTTSTNGYVEPTTD